MVSQTHPNLDADAGAPAHAPESERPRRPAVAEVPEALRVIDLLRRTLDRLPE